ncbi:UMP kinase [Candidatus Uhrbacteria bacterium]|nr:UMP kinase [Candidatus Uhrbacteria bacterium]
MLYVLSLGGSVIVPNGEIDTAYLRTFNRFVRSRVKRGDHFVIVTGGGGVARQYQNAARAITRLTRDDLDWLGLHVTRLNGHLLRTMFRDLARPALCKDPSRIHASTKYPIVIAAGWKPGWSTDYIAVRIAKRLKAQMVVNLSNIHYVYDKDPRMHKHARRFERMSWNQFRAIVGTKWDPGLHVPFDPVASRLAHHAHIPVVVVNGRGFKNIERVLNGDAFRGTRIE